MPETRTVWRQRRALSTSTVAFAFVIVLMVALIAYATSVSGSVATSPCNTVGSTSSASDAIKIGFVTELSGSAVSDGYGARVAAELAVNETNASGGIDGKPVDLVVVDSRTNPQQATKCADALDQQGVLAITGPDRPGRRSGRPGYAEASGVPFVVSAISSATLSAPDSNWTVSVQPDAVQWGAAVAKYVSEAVPGAKIALMTQNAEQQKEMAAGRQVVREHLQERERGLRPALRERPIPLGDGGRGGQAFGGERGRRILASDRGLLRVQRRRGAAVCWVPAEPDIRRLTRPTKSATSGWTPPASGGRHFSTAPWRRGIRTLPRSRTSFSHS